MRIPPHILARGEKRAGCEHLQKETSEHFKTLLKRYTAGLRYGQKLLDGQIKPRDGTEDEPAREKRRKVRGMCMTYLGS